MFNQQTGVAMADAVTDRTPRDDGFAMPPEWAPHQLTLMSWPCRPETYRGGPDAIDRAKTQQAGIANAVAAFEPVLMLVRPEQTAEARRALATSVDLFEIDLDDAWARDNGPIFVADATGALALVQFAFNGWGGRCPSTHDARVPAAIAAYLGVRRYVAPMVLEGGSFHVDGEGTLLTTEACLLHPNRNPSLTRADIEATLRAYLGIDRVIWLGEGHYLDPDTDGHVDVIAHFIRPGRVIVHAPADPAHLDHARGAGNVRRLRDARDARGRAVEIVEFDTGGPSGIPYLNCYVCNGAVIAPIAGEPMDAVALDILRREYADREIVPVPAGALFAGGGGPHCITQQVPAGPFVPGASTL